jgi:hypothetical protein
VIGNDLALWIRGDYVIADATLNRFFAFHVIALPLVLLGLVAAHILALHEVGSNNPDGIEIKKHKDPKTGIPLDGIPFHPYYTVKDIVGVVVFLMVFSIIVFFAPEMGGYFLEYNNFIPADPLKTPPHIAPVWYFTPYYSILRANTVNFFWVDAKLWGVIFMGLGGDDPVLPALARPQPGEVDPLPRPDLQVGAGDLRRRLRDPRLPRHEAADAFFGIVHDPISQGLHDHLFPVLPADALVHPHRQVQAGAGEGDRMSAALSER